MAATRPRRLVLMALVLASALGAACAAGNSEMTLDRSIKQRLNLESSSSILEETSAQTRVFATQEEWAEFWKSLKVDPPQFDESTTAAAVTFAGPKPSSGYAVEIQKIQYDEAARKLIVTIKQSEPAGGGATLTVMTYPFDAVLFPKPGAWDEVVVKSGTK